MNYLSLFSGIEAASVAWRPLGWQCVGVAEIDPFPCAVLAHHYPDAPNLGSVTDITDEQIAALGAIDVVVGGSPCQDLSVAGKRAGLAGERSGLFHEQLRIFHATRHLCGARFLVWENVPGAFSSHAGRDFAVVVGAMAGCRVDVPEDGWGTEGVALGEHGLVEWAVLDAQWFGVAQRRRRVFAVLDVGDWAGRPPILLESDRLRGDSAPSREAGEGVARPIAAGSARGSGYRDDADAADNLIPAPHADLSPALKARDSKGSSSDGDGDGAILVPMVAPTLRAGGNRTGGDRPPGTDVDTADSLVVTHSLRAEGFDASEDGTGRGTPTAAIAIQAGAIKTNPKIGPDGVGIRVDDCAYTLEARAEVQAVAFMADDYKDGGYEECDIARPLTTSADRTRAAPVVAFSAKDHGADAGEVAPTPRSMGHDGSHANGGGQVAVCIHADAVGRTGDALTPSADAEGRVRLRPPGVGIASDGTTYNLVATGQPHAVAFESRFARNGRGAPSDVVPPLKAQSGETGKGDAAPLLATAVHVRRLTPVECARLQGFPDDYLLQVPWRGKTPPPDGPMYKALGNSMAVPVMRWIGQQIAAAASSRIAA